MNQKKRKQKSSPSMRTCIRFEPDEYARLLEECERTGRTIPSLLKESHFSKAPIQPLMSKKDVKKFFVELARLGNNLNQITKKVNAGLGFGWVDSADRLVIELQTLRRNVMKYYVGNQG